MTDLEQLARITAERDYRSSDPVVIFQVYNVLRERRGLSPVAWSDYLVGRRGDP